MFTPKINNLLAFVALMFLLIIPACVSVYKGVGEQPVFRGSR